MTPRASGTASWRLGTRLYVAQAVVLLASVATAGLVAALIGPSLFHDHLLQAGHTADSPEVAHIEQAFADAGIVSLSAGLLVALAFALAVSWYLTRRIGRPVGTLTDAARRVRDGDYAARVTITEGGPELATLGESFNLMADRLGNIETTRRRLLSDLAHEMRTPVATLNAHLEGIADGVTPWDDDTRRILEQQAERLSRLARDLDEVSRAEEGRIDVAPEDCSLTDLVRSAVDQARVPYDTKGVSLVSRLDDVAVRADPLRTAQVLGNLLANALRHTPAGGSVTVTGTRLAPGSVTVTVADTGEGMTDEQLAHVFERFYRGDSARAVDRAGSGIGLTIARALADAQGGSLTATSSGSGQGSSFTLVLPAAGR